MPVNDYSSWIEGTRPQCPAMMGSFVTMWNRQVRATPYGSSHTIVDIYLQHHRKMFDDKVYRLRSHRIPRVPSLTVAIVVGMLPLSPRHNFAQNNIMVLMLRLCGMENSFIPPPSQSQKMVLLLSDECLIFIHGRWFMVQRLTAS